VSCRENAILKGHFKTSDRVADYPLRSEGVGRHGGLQTGFEMTCKEAIDVALHTLFLSYRGGAAFRHLPFELTKEQCIRLFLSACTYCGVEPKTGKKQSECRLSGIDRQDSAIGYTVANCVPCCTDCNYAKRKRSVGEFLEWAQRLARHQGRAQGACAGGDEASARHWHAGTPRSQRPALPSRQ
jgi:hypothetical protein